ncbi:MAG: DNA-binding protein [Sulfobacillus benefaciens]|uniref:DNA-binding protein n=1 Tax=Sulfobacillus benefaciens TaxID=453960 RepID=A0A2T2X6P0_9FIRM|nr:MAG: DNA-binding protein [Sulfobacillus benefaciens]
MERQFFTVQEIAELTGFSKVTLYRAISRQEIPTIKIGVALRIPKTWLDQVLNAGATASLEVQA